MIKQLALALLSLASVLLCSCGSKEGRPEFVFTYSVFFPSTHIHAVLAQEWADELNSRSQGRIRVDVFPGGVLSSAAENYKSVTKGVSDFGMSCFSYSRGLFPMIEGLDLPWGYESGQQASLIANRFIEHFKPAELDKIVFMYAHAHGPGILASRKKISSAKEFAGMTIRGTGVSAQMIRALGANPVGMSQGDAYEALRKGVVDATLCPVETLKGWKQGEVIEHVIHVPAAAYTTAMFVVMNQKSWQRLPADLQELIKELNLEWQLKHGLAWNQADSDGEEFVKQLGGKSFSAFPEQENAQVREALYPLLQAWADRLDAQGLPGKEALEFMNAQFTK
ncbi:MAG: TRAP transporter substrate-binding protein [Oligosphaeraceae bacterium]|nr:TRAP transporter substrate-binding protein [Oligosphaeraceae bacterium]